MRNHRRVLELLLVLVVSLSAPGCATDTDRADRGPPKGRVEMRLAESEPGVGLVEARLRDGDEVIYLHEQAELVASDFLLVEETTSETGQPAIGFRLTAKGAKKLGALTDANLGKMLAVLVDDIVVVSAKIQDTIWSAGQITGSFSREQVADIVRAINGE